VTAPTVFCGPCGDDVFGCSPDNPCCFAAGCPCRDDDYGDCELVRVGEDGCYCLTHKIGN
jgi:hypothetical protein